MASIHSPPPLPYSVFREWSEEAGQWAVQQSVWTTPKAEGQVVTENWVGPKWWLGGDHVAGNRFSTSSQWGITHWRQKSSCLCQVGAPWAQQPSGFASMLQGAWQPSCSEKAGLHLFVSLLLSDPSGSLQKERKFLQESMAWCRITSRHPHVQGRLWKRNLKMLECHKGKVYRFFFSLTVHCSLCGVIKRKKGRKRKKKK